MTYQLIETKTLGTAAASIEFTSIPQDGTDLLVVLSMRDTGGSEASGFFLRFNSSTTGYSLRRMSGTGSSVFTDTADELLWVNGNTSTSNTFSSVQVYVPNYRGNTNKSFSLDGVLENNATLGYNAIVAGLWANTAAISTITVTQPSGRNFAVGTSVSLYKITNGTSNGVVVS